MKKLGELRFRNVAGAEARVREFINLAYQQLDGTLVANANYSEISWDVTNAFVVKGLKSRFRLHFVNSVFKVNKSSSLGAPLATPFVEFAKAYIRYRHATKPVSYSATNRRVFGLRCVEAAFRDLGHPPEIWHLDAAILTRAVELSTTGKARSTAYKLGSEIEGLHNFCVEMQFLVNAFKWSHGVPYVGKTSIKVGEEFDRRCTGKLLSSDAIRTLVERCHASADWPDRVYSCIAALLITFPIKAHELLQLRMNPEVEVTKAGKDGERRTDFGLQIWPRRGDPPQVRWVLNSEYATIAMRSVHTLRDMLTPARELARWYELNPDKLYLPPHLEHLRKAEWLVVSEVQDIIGSSRTRAHEWIDANGINKRVGERRVTEGRGQGKNLTEVRFGDVERTVLSLLPKDFPYVNGDESGHRYSEALLVVPLHALHTRRSPWKCMFEPVGYEQFYVWFRDRMTRRQNLAPSQPV